jgi:hypothetical protein
MGFLSMKIATRRGILKELATENCEGTQPTRETEKKKGHTARKPCWWNCQKPFTEDEAVKRDLTALTMGTKTTVAPPTASRARCIQFLAPVKENDTGST